MTSVRPRTSVGLKLSSVVPSPSSPEEFSPQHFTRPGESRAQVCAAPEETAMTSVSPVTCVGFKLSSVVPLPVRSSTPILPQHLTPPVDSRAQVWFQPLEIATTPVRPGTSTGFSLSSFVPSPSCPSSFQPQHFTPPDESRAQVCESPAEIAVASVMPATSVGVERSSVVPSPSAPWTFLPQHFTLPEESKAQEYAPPAEIADDL